MSDLKFDKDSDFFTDGLIFHYNGDGTVQWHMGKTNGTILKNYARGNYPTWEKLHSFAGTGDIKIGPVPAYQIEEINEIEKANKRLKGKSIRGIAVSLTDENELRLMRLNFRIQAAVGTPFPITGKFTSAEGEQEIVFANLGEFMGFADAFLTEKGAL